MRSTLALSTISLAALAGLTAACGDSGGRSEGSASASASASATLGSGSLTHTGSSGEGTGDGVAPPLQLTAKLDGVPVVASWSSGATFLGSVDDNGIWDAVTRQELDNFGLDGVILKMPAFAPNGRNLAYVDHNNARGARCGRLSHAHARTFTGRTGRTCCRLARHPP